MAAALQNAQLNLNNLLAGEPGAVKTLEMPEVAGVFRGRELTLKDRRVASGLPSIDRLIGGGIVRGRISEILGNTGAGKKSLAMRFAAGITRHEAAAWIETGDNLDPASLIATGIEPARMLWVSCRESKLSRRIDRMIAPEDRDSAAAMKSGWRRQLPIASLKAAEWILAAGGFGLVILDFGPIVRFIPQSAALRLARAAERSNAAVIVMGDRSLCGTFAVLSLELRRRRSCFNRTASGAPATFDGQLIEARVTRNKLGGSGHAVVWQAPIDPLLTDPIQNIAPFVSDQRSFEAR
jgi:hypothetical protein